MATVSQPGAQAAGHPPASSGPAAPAWSGAGSDAGVSPYRWIILVGLITASIMEVLDTTIVNVALPQMAGNLNATTDEIAWVSTGYILSNVVVLPMTAWLAGRYGRRNYLCFSILLFIISSFFCGTSDTLGALVFWRIMQGAGGAALLSTAQATLREIFPRSQQTMVQTIFVMGIVVAPTVGPTLGGYITDNFNWGWVFFINVPIGIISLVLVYSLLQDSQFARRSAGIDWLGIVLLTVGLGSLQYVLEEGERYDWFNDPWITRLTVISLASLTLFVLWVLSPRNKNPVVELQVLQNRGFRSGLIVFLALGFGLYGGIFIFPLFAQTVLHFSPTTTGLVLLPGGLASAVGAMICGRLLSGTRRLADPRALVCIGFVLFVWSMWDLGHLSIDSGEPDTRWGLLVRGFGLGFLFTPINQAIFSALKGRELDFQCDPTAR
ncbi:MAG: DHA2 family efflux MFS transporter permease subunit [Capsulimonadaceae bacterium]